MARHIADQPRDRAEGARVREFTRIEREQADNGPHAMARELHRRAPGRAEGRRAQEFLHRDRQKAD